MNLGIIAHNSKKVLIEDFCIAYKNILAKHESTRQVQPDEESKKRQASMCINSLPAALAETSSLWKW